VSELKEGKRRRRKRDEDDIFFPIIISINIQSNRENKNSQWIDSDSVFVHDG
jgi:hypothetical protein